MPPVPIITKGLRSPAETEINFLASPEAKELRQATERYEAICAELVRRGAKYA